MCMYGIEYFLIVFFEFILCYGGFYKSFIVDGYRILLVVEGNGFVIFKIGIF